MADPSELRTAIREMILIIQRISDNTGDERENLKSLFSHSTIVFNFLETTGRHEKKQDLTQTMKALIEAVKAKDPANVDAAIAKLTGLMKDIVTEVKLYAAQNEQQHSTAKRNPPIVKRSDANEHTIHAPSNSLASAPPLHQDVNKTADTEIRRIVLDEAREKRLPRADVAETDSPLGENLERSSQNVAGWLRLITYLSALQGKQDTR